MYRFGTYGKWRAITAVTLKKRMIQHLTFLSLFVRVVLKPRVFIPSFILTLKTLEGKTKVKKHNKQQK